MNESQRSILAVISDDGKVTVPELAAKIGISERNIMANIRTLKEAGILIRKGGRKEGYWEIITQE